MTQILFWQLLTIFEFAVPSTINCEICVSVSCKIFRENCIHTKINQDFFLHIQNQKFKGLLCTVEILEKTVNLRN